MSSFFKQAELWLAIRQNRLRIKRLAGQVASHAVPSSQQRPLVFFNASSRLFGLSQNAAFSLLTSWSLRLAGVPVVHFVCQEGMRPCVLGTNRQDYTQPPPCETCIAQSRRLYRSAEIYEFASQEDAGLKAALENLDLSELIQFEYEPGFAAIRERIPLGALVLPSLRWALRRHTLPDDEPTGYLLRQYMLSAFNVADKFASLLETVKPQAAVIFNGIMYPEAAARWVARQLGVRSVAHEVGFQPLSVFFTEGEPTAYPIHIPPDFELTPEQNARLDAYLEKRFQGKFSMAGIQFWPEMRDLDEGFLKKAAGFRQIVPVFTNVVYDTSQVHANVIFPHMFAWLDQTLAAIRAHPETLFVIRAHPDEMRPGTAKQSQESVRAWVKQHGVDQLDNVVFIDSQEYLSSYALIQRSKFVIVYNSSIGLEASLLGKPVLCAGKARYTQYPTVHLAGSEAGYRQLVEQFLVSEVLQAPLDYQRQARRFLYYQLYRASIPLGDYLESIPRLGFVHLRPFSWEQLLPENSPSLNTLHRGILNGEPFLIPEVE
ncbi:MAG TPA: hypothetical protein VLA49_14155, partial [Anaerolineales bacterium]|nr:hypothetical protein [Anaerolineales bacterium]